MYLLSAAAVGFLIVFRVLTAGNACAPFPEARRAARSSGGAIPFDEACQG
jgi:hypothetical protein